MTAIDDLDGGGLLDVVTVNKDYEVSLFYGSCSLSCISSELGTGLWTLDLMPIWGYMSFAGVFLVAVDDLDADGHRDLVVSATSLNDKGGIAVVSGKTGSLLYTVEHSGAVGDKFGCSVDSVADLDDDNIPELIVGTRGHDPGPPLSGYVSVLSGASGVLLSTIENSYSITANFGQKVANAGDWDGDGLPDCFILARRDFAWFAGEVVVRVYSLATGNCLASFLTGLRTSMLTSADFNLFTGDFNCDGILDFVVEGLNEFEAIHEAKAFSGLDGSVLWHYEPSQISSKYGERSRASFLIPSTDFDGDGCADFAVVNDGRLFVNSDQRNGWTGALELYCGATGAPFNRALIPIFDTYNFGADAVCLSDSSEADSPTFAVGSYSSSVKDTTEEGFVEIWKYWPGISPQRVEVSAAIGGSTDFKLEMPPGRFAHAKYRLLLSKHGHSGFWNGGLYVPLTFDSLTLATSQGFVPGGVSFAVGHLNTFGEGSVQFDLPAGAWMPFVGQSMFAAVVVETASELVSTVSVEIAVTP
ncbi:MAG: hypothetical protein HN844_08280 [Planctomycetes bacterium]|nr:hypothetical protein [Planctomycetota bacterium]MBT7319198.1 hypothetical protein [Planctomycetota bacterium]